jgi:membrane-associated protease RseP (regulator of RpoE activity)
MLLFVSLYSAAFILHLLTMHLTGVICGVQVKKVSIGFGPSLFQTSRFELRVFPWGGSVTFKDSRTNTALDQSISDAFDQQPVWRQFLITSSGCCMLLFISVAMGGTKGIDEFVSGFHLFLLEAFNFSVFSSLFGYIKTASASDLFIAITAKVAALSLIPYFGSNGLHLIQILIKGFWKNFEFGQRSLRIIGIFSVTFFGLWFANLAYFLVSTFL